MGYLTMCALSARARSGTTWRSCAAIRDYLLQRVEHGTVQDRAGVVAALHEAGLDVPRQGDHYVTPCETRPPTSGGG